MAHPSGPHRASAMNPPTRIADGAINNRTFFIISIAPEMAFVSTPQYNNTKPMPVKT
jgi:hypothetical protein